MWAIGRDLAGAAEPRHFQKFVMKSFVCPGHLTKSQLPVSLVSNQIKHSPLDFTQAESPFRDERCGGRHP
jgi:hypothetical protein